MSALDWHAPLFTKHDEPRVAQIMPPSPPETRRRVRIGRFAGWEATDRGVEQATTWLYDERGCCSVIGKAGEFDLTNRSVAA